MGTTSMKIKLIHSSVKGVRLKHDFIPFLHYEPMYSPVHRLYGNSLKRVGMRRCFAEWIIGMDQLQKQT